jgi:prophage tail gpP-like protein
VQQNTRLRAQRLDDGDDWDEEDFEDWDGEPGSGTDRDADRGAAVITQVVSQARDYGITRYRPKVIIAETQADDLGAEKRADWEMRRRIAEGLSAKVTVTGWRQENGRLWTVNEMVDVDVPWLGLEREMLIGEVEYSIGEGGEIATLSLTLPDAFLPEKIRHTKGGGRGRTVARGRAKKEKADLWKDVVRPPEAST